MQHKNCKARTVNQKTTKPELSSAIHKRRIVQREFWNSTTVKCKRKSRSSKLCKRCKPREPRKLRKTHIPRKSKNRTNPKCRQPRNPRKPQNPHKPCKACKRHKLQTPNCKLQIAKRNRSSQTTKQKLKCTMCKGGRDNRGWRIEMKTLRKADILLTMWRKRNTVIMDIKTLFCLEWCPVLFPVEHWFYWIFF